jgi:hypothetical protein
MGVGVEELEIRVEALLSEGLGGVSHDLDVLLRHRHTGTPEAAGA